MKRNDMLTQLTQLLVIAKSNNLGYSETAREVLSLIEKRGMLPPGYMKPIPFEYDGKQYPLVPGDYKNEQGIWCTPGQHEWEPEDEKETT